MHVLFLPSWYPDSPEDIAGSFFREQAIALGQIGIKVGVIAPALRSLRQPTSVLTSLKGCRKELDSAVWTYRASIVHMTPHFWWLTAPRVCAKVRRLFDAYVADHGRPDIFHLHGAIPAGAAAKDFLEATGIPYIISEHSTAYARGLVRHGAVNAARTLMMGAKRRFAVSKPFASVLQDRLALPDGCVEVMPNPVDDRFLSPPLIPTGSRPFQFTHVSLLDEKKNVGLLLRAFAKASRTMSRARLTIGGDGPNRSTLEKLAGELGIADRVEFLGLLSRSRVVELLGRSDAFVLSSDFETFGVAVVEALAMGLPVISTRCGGPEDFLLEDDGLVVPVRDEIALADAMSRVASGQLKEHRSERRARCRARFGTDVIVRQWAEIYSETCNSNLAKT